MVQRVKHPEKLGDHLGAPDEHDVSFVVLFDGWVDDLVRLHASLGLCGGSWEFVVVDNPVDDAASDTIASLGRVRHVPLVQQMGFGGGRNLGLRLATGRIAVVIDTSVEFNGDPLAPIARTLDDPGVGLVGRWGVRTENGFDYTESVDPAHPDVHGVEAYLMAARRSTLAEVGLFDAKFKWYRNADMDLSFKIRAAGYRTIVDPAIPAVRHEHRLWETTPVLERDEASRKNFWRFHDHWKDRPDLLELPG